MLAKSFLKITPTLILESQLDESDDCNGRDSSYSDSKGRGGVTYPNPLRVWS